MKAYLSLLLFAVAVGSWAGPVTISQTQIGNVSTSQFTLFWQVDDVSSPGLDIFADAGGITSLNGQLGVEFFPLEMHDIMTNATAEDREARRALQDLVSSRGVVLARVTGAAPGASYHVRPRSYDEAGLSNEAATAPLAPVTTAQSTGFIAESRQLRVGFGGCLAGSQGLVMKLALAGSPYPLFAVVGDHGLEEQALFDLGSLLNGAGFTNAQLSGTPQFTLELMGPLAPPGTNTTDVAFNGTHVVAKITDSVFLVTFPGLAYFSMEAVTSPLQGVPFVFNLTARAANGTVLTSYNGNVDLVTGGASDLFEGDGETASFANGVLSNYQVIPAVTGNIQFTFTRPCGPETGTETLAFAPLTFAAWQARFFGADAGNELIAGFDVDYEFDGLANGLEYLMGRDPTRRNGPATTPFDPDSDDFVFEYWRSRIAPGVASTPVWSQDMSLWRSDLISQQVVETAGAYERLEVRVTGGALLPRVFAGIRAFVSP